ncbi:hypothetical protein [Corynebacterium cystitidis]|uniref:hypothetical protein n=1 Tax=Corynebacterium cystitidis TaxID=35757 RepID=UPI00211DE9EF|nr:hypothetical protein [Corynebacterium cystitidis]
MSVTDPRSSGNSTLLRELYSDLPYVNLEDLTLRNLAVDAPEFFSVLQVESGRTRTRTRPLTK